MCVGGGGLSKRPRMGKTCHVVRVCNRAGAGKLADVGAKSQRRKKQELEPFGKKIRSKSCLENKQELELLKNYAALQPWYHNKTALV